MQPSGASASVTGPPSGMSKIPPSTGRIPPMKAIRFGTTALISAVSAGGIRPGWRRMPQANSAVSAMSSRGNLSRAYSVMKPGSAFCAVRQARLFMYLPSSEA